MFLILRLPTSTAHFLSINIGLKSTLAKTCVSQRIFSSEVTSDLRIFDIFSPRKMFSSNLLKPDPLPLCNVLPTLVSTGELLLILKIQLCSHCLMEDFSSRSPQLQELTRELSLMRLSGLLCLLLPGYMSFSG